MHWTVWAGSHADGTGTASLDDCTPNCAAGTFTSYPVLVHADQVHACSATDPRRYYNRLIIAFPNRAPGGVGTPTLRYRGHPAFSYDEIPMGCVPPPPSP
jgi:hypothetical protein